MAIRQLPEYATLCVARLRSGAAKRRSLREAAEARDDRRLKGGGRAWINGREVEGTDNRHVRITRS